MFGTGEGTDYVKLIRTLLELQNLKSSIDLSDFRRGLQDIREERNAVAHGLWLKDPDTGAPRIHATSGEWKPVPDEGKVTRKIKPEAAQFDRKTADALISRINETIELTKKLLGEVKSQLSKEGDATLDSASATVEDEDTLSASVAVMVSAINTPITDGTGFKIFKG